MFFFNGQRETAGYVRVDGLGANLGLPADAANVPFSAGATPARAANGAANAVVSAGETSEAEFLFWRFRGDHAATPGRQVSFTTKGGGNEFHGGAWGKFDGAFLRANDWFANRNGLARPVANRTNFGGAFGGRIIENKLSFFTTYEGLRGRDAAFALTDVPTLAARRNADAVLRPLLNAFPLPNGAARNDGMAEFAAAYANPSRHDFASARVDGYAFNSRSRFSSRYTYSASDATTRAANGFAPNVRQQSDNRTQTLSGAGQYFNGYKGVEVRANYSRASLAQEFSLDDFGGAQPLAAANSGGFYRYELLGRNAGLAFGPARENLLRQLNLNGDFTFNRGDHDWRLGGDFRRLWLTLQPQTAETGLLLSDIVSAPARVARFNAFARDASVKPHLDNFSAYAQYGWRASYYSNVSLGLRWSVAPPPRAVAQTAPLYSTDFGNFAPRVGLAWSFPKNNYRTTLRFGLGWYYELSNTGAAQVFGQSFPFVRGRAAFGLPLTTLTLDAGGAAESQTRLAFAPSLRTPYSRQLSVSAQHNLNNNLTLTATFQDAQGRRLWLTRTLFDAATAVTRFTDNAATAHYRAFNLRLQAVRFHGFDWLLNYVWARARDNYTPDTLAQSYAVSANPAQDSGPADFDARHSLRGFAVYSLANHYENAWASRLLRRWQVSTLFHWRGATPLNVVYGRLNGFGVTYSRPDLRPGAAVFATDAGPLRQLNAAAFALPAGAGNGNLPRNSLRGYGFAQLDLALSRSFSLTQETSLTFRAEAANLLNHANFVALSGFDASLGTVLPDGSFTPNTAFGQTRATVGQDNSAGANFLAPYQSGGARAVRLALSFKF